MKLLVIVALFSLGACSAVVPERWAYGTYVATYPYGTSTIVLHRNGTLTQRVALHGHRLVVVRGRWRFGRRAYLDQIVFYGTLMGVENRFVWTVASATFAGNATGTATALEMK